jgi:hypothetical protein
MMGYTRSSGLGTYCTSYLTELALEAGLAALTRCHAQDVGDVLGTKSQPLATKAKVLRVGWSC